MDEQKENKKEKEPEEDHQLVQDSSSFKGGMHRIISHSHLPSHSHSQSIGMWTSGMLS